MFSIDVIKATPFCGTDCPNFEIEDLAFYAENRKYSTAYSCAHREICRHIYEEMKSEEMP